MARTDGRLSIGMFGLRGLHPDREISGFETAFAEIAPRLAARGHDVTIYARAGAHSPERRVPREDGVELRYMPSPGGKNFSALSSTLFSVTHALARQRFDVWFFVNVGMGHHAALARLSGKPVVISVDGLDWTRAKWGPVARTYFRSAAHSAARFATRVVTDAHAMREYYRTQLHCDSVMISYGAAVETSANAARLAEVQCRPREYYLIVSRLIPENSLDLMLEGFSRSNSARELIVVGGATYTDAFHRRLTQLAAADRRIRLVGQITDQDLLKELWCNCYAYLHGHSVGGTNPALLRAMGYGSCVLARDTAFNREALADAGLYFAPLTAAVTRAITLLESTPAAVEHCRSAAAERVRREYDWQRVTSQYEALFRSVAQRAPAAARWRDALR